MAYRVVTLGNGDTVRISESVLKGAGPRGLPGPPGPPGSATTIRGRYDSYDDLVANVPLGLQGEAYIVSDTGHLWAWDTEVEEGDGVWRDCGRVVGPPAVMSIGAMRTGDASASIIGGQQWSAVYDSLVYNDPDPLSGSVLREASLTPTETVFDCLDKAHHLAVSEVSVIPGVNSPSIDIYWLESSSGEEVGRTTYAPQRGERWRTTHIAALRTDSAMAWRLVVVPSINTSIESVATEFSRIGGGTGPQGVPGPYPVLTAASPQNLPHGSSPTASFTQTAEGEYTLNLGLVQGAPGEAQSGFSSMDSLVGGADSSSQPADYAPVLATDQEIPVPGRTTKPHVPYFLAAIAEHIHRRIVSRLSPEQLAARGTAQPGEVAYNTGTGQYLGGDSAGSWQIIPTIQYGTDPSVVHNAATDRPDGSLYFKHEA